MFILNLVFDIFLLSTEVLYYHFNKFKKSETDFIFADTLNFEKSFVSL